MSGGNSEALNEPRRVHSIAEVIVDADRDVVVREKRYGILAGKLAQDARKPGELRDGRRARVTFRQVTLERAAIV
jgi:hypothetical protein